MLQSYEGGCHCGAVRYRVRADLERITVCNCSMCTRKGSLNLVVEPADFTLLKGEADLTTYQFGTRTAKHTFCCHCGIHSFYVPRSYPDKICLNARCLDGLDVADLRPARFFDGQHWEEAMAARRTAEAEAGH
jgi:hypothetical protein